ncbi:MAG TPA: CRISPR system precrRNA processing endoribonuclease RAMP protein Cas6 [Leptospiraceae bacterium]|nr:CRISPR system precrRNA processing endoribonuclease RAMP protein Cas6 [Leptospiraceae bacterium]HMX34280.1 CRISPR system precrRNA processing endoribonuclease RAMP protein Cas6 [Leptospiraceae bacterium]HMY32691.1 CRISPR system precrRNA processing endoribonuclease RAMP protein Cas6 [Leptospiraceae bacterium]HMZ64881.1 CRISPR system precrRNA processing endoribonuclease RAMP protein Cas6 [Leptospiraceae bacterium]HNA05390.1 CRISPR system precrRNA processing endoribonuclease RAMP protein Cas6 [Le
MLKSKLNFSKVRVFFEALEDCKLPRFSGSFLRGTFGHALKEAFCVMAHRNCAKCMVRDSCGYFQVFESQDETKRQDGFLYKPHPYILTPCLKNEFKKGEILEFSITIFGEAIRYMPYFIFSFQKMGEKGFGVERYKFNLTQIKDFYTGNSVYDGSLISSRNITELTIQEFASKLCPNPTQENLNYILSFETPARFVENKKDVHILSPSILLDSMIRRYKTMHQFYGEFIDSDLELGNLQLSPYKKQRYISWKRYSNRQGRTLDQGGISGSYQVSLTEPKLALFLYCMEILHVGKSTTFGLGKVGIESLQQDIAMIGG